MCQHEEEQVARVCDAQGDEKDAGRGVAVDSLLHYPVPDQHGETISQQSNDRYSYA